jgi:hypothetical protein
MAALGIIELAQRGDCTPTKCEVGEVAMSTGAGFGAEIEGTHRPNSIEERPFEVRILAIKKLHVVDVVFIKVGGPCREYTCG